MSEQRIALVTGSYRGIGLATVSELANQGYKVILSSRVEEKGRAALSSLTDQSNVVYHQLDINDQASVDEMVSFIENEFGRLDVLINNAGISYDTWNSAINADMDDVQRTMETNFFGAWRMIQACYPLMQRNGYGRIVNVSSGAGSMATMHAGHPGYAASKAAMNVLTKKVAAESSSNILINSVCPGWVRTEMGGMEAPRSTEEGAASVIWAATLPDNGPNGGFFRDGEVVEF